ncbi:MAG: aminopeptidase [Minicystis sp.]
MTATAPALSPTGRPSRLATLFLALAALSFHTGCTTFGYLAQAGAGQLDLGLRSRKIAHVIADPATPPRLRELLSQVRAIKAFGERQGLTPTSSYNDYVALDRSVVVYVVTASEPLRFHSKTWSFPIAGRVPYLGWFNRDDAHAFADGLRDEGWDADVGGASAYSTLGWFKDPILSTMIPDGDEAPGDLAEVVLHESLHATIYVNGQSSFNENLASFVGEGLCRRYLDERFGPASAEKGAYERAEAEGRARRAAMHETYDRLKALYASARPDTEKLSEKSRILIDLRAKIGFKRPINNATLAGLETYHEGSPELEALLTACGGSFPRFLAAMKTVEGRSFGKELERDLGKVVRPLIEKGCIGRAREPAHD